MKREPFPCGDYVWNKIQDFRIFLGVGRQTLLKKFDLVALHHGGPLLPISPPIAHRISLASKTSSILCLPGPWGPPLADNGISVCNFATYLILKRKNKPKVQKTQQANDTKAKKAICTAPSTPRHKNLCLTDKVKDKATHDPAELHQLASRILLRKKLHQSSSQPLRDVNSNLDIITFHRSLKKNPRIKEEGSDPDGPLHPPLHEDTWPLSHKLLHRSKNVLAHVFPEPAELSRSVCPASNQCSRLCNCAFFQVLKRGKYVYTYHCQPDDHWQ